MKPKCLIVIAISFIVILFSSELLTAQISGYLKQKTEPATQLHRQNNYGLGLSSFNVYIKNSALATNSLIVI